ncbi:hypothetical protein NNC19_20545 [Clostridium sp. SHJSY1]|uniref:hypothetical protein n=1 Tax=Clostridium sp. SHJSY1 TaxID=2942483 RepID=UPI002875EC01|nr:hypothetical protein [Clostridium sp. SHJSY1]MDS0528088.1 hypothetical protein [Clostridium sp. SHJSY1]
MENTIKTSKSPLILGILGLIAWFIPIIGLPVNVAGIIVSIIKVKSEKTTISKVGLAFSIIGLILTFINGYLGYQLMMSKLS